jgi:alkylation response protein AidB-like acyl-CoA dehydrogenase
MDLALSDEQEQLVESFGALLDKRSAPEHVRAAEPLGFDASLWAALRELGSVHMAMDEEHGGWGATMLDLCLVADSIGQHCAPAPLIEAQVTARLLARVGAEALGAPLANGAPMTLALRKPVDGIARLVPAAAVAAMVLIRYDDEVLAVRSDPPPPQVPNHADLPLGDVPLADASVVATGPEAIRAYEAAIDEWLLLTGGALVGLATKALGQAVEYAKERHAFGSPIGSFQGIAHRLADVATGIEGARLLVHEAAWTADNRSEDAAEHACGAFAFAADVAREATYWACHTLGGYGVMVEYDTQLYFRRARGWAGVFGGTNAGYRRAARHRYGRGVV